MQIAEAQSDLLEKLAQLGWTLSKVDFKQGIYVAKGDGPGGQKIERSGNSPQMAIAALIHFAVRANGVRQYAARRIYAAWSSDWLNQSEEIAQAYADMPDFDEKAVPAWKALAAESKIQADAIKRQIHVEVVPDPEPYQDAKTMCEDVHQNRHFFVSNANSDHPVWTVDDNVNFRIVHDVLGHCQAGAAPFSWVGENLACGAHFPLVSPLAREALMVECIAQTAYFKHYKGFGNQKVGLLSEYLHPVQDQEGEHVFVPHGGTPQLQAQPQDATAPNTQGAGQWVAPAQYDPAAQMQPNLVSSSEQPSIDPNAGWEPALLPGEAQPTINSQPGDEGRDYIGKMATVLNAQKIDTEWWDKEPATQDQAIMNAFRVALLSPRKHLKWNAAHYQAIMHTHPKTGAQDLWNTLEEAREKHNRALGHSPESHLNYRYQRDYLAHMLQTEHPELDEAEAQRQAKRVIYEKTKEFEHQISEEDEGATSELKRYLKARKMVEQWLRDNYTPIKPKGKGKWIPGQQQINDVLAGWKISGPSHHPMEAYSPDDYEQEQMQLDDPVRPTNKDMSGASNDEAKYGAFMSSQIEPIAEVGQHIEEIRQAALKDIEEGGGQGYVFRNSVVHLGISGLGPKVVSFVWLMLRPMSSELGVVDTHILRGMRIPENKMTRKDFYKVERMQHAAKDASGYQHLPLGLYHWGMWDMVRTPGEHSDHSTMRVLDPVPWDSPRVKFDNAMNSRAGVYTGPDQFEATRPIMERVGQEFDDEFKGQPQNRVPVKTASIKTGEKTVREKRKELKEKLEDFNINVDEHARRFGFFAALQVMVTLKQFKDFLKEQDDKHKFNDTNWARFKKLALESYERWDEGGPAVWLW